MGSMLGKVLCFKKQGWATACVVLTAISAVMLSPCGGELASTVGAMCGAGVTVPWRVYSQVTV